MKCAETRKSIKLKAGREGFVERNMIRPGAPLPSQKAYAQTNHGSNICVRGGWGPGEGGRVHRKKKKSYRYKYIAKLEPNFPMQI